MSEIIASWVQAIGSIAAIAATWYIARKEDHSKQEEIVARGKIVHHAFNTLAWKAHEKMKELNRELAEANKDDRSANAELLPVVEALLDGLRKADPLQLSNKESIGPFYEVRSNLEEAISYARRILRPGPFKQHEDLILLLSLEGALEAAGIAIREFAQKP